MSAAEHPRVTVVTPVFNGERWLGAAIESVLAQDYPGEVEHWVVDDGSTDSSAKVAAGYEGVRVVRQENAGPGAARNAGIEAGTGELIAMLDADDRMVEHRLSLQVAHLRDPEVHGVLGRQRVELADGVEAPPWVLHERTLKDLAPGTDLGVTVPARAAESAADPYYPFATLTLWRSAAERIGPFDTSFNHGEDIDYLLRGWDAGLRFELLDEVLIERLVHGGNLTSDIAAAESGVLRAFKRRIDRKRAAAGGSGTIPSPAEDSPDRE